MSRRRHALHLLPQALALEPGTYKRPHNPLPNHIASTLSVFMDGALHGLYTQTKTRTLTHTHIHTHTKKRKETHNPLLNGDANLAHHN